LQHGGFGGWAESQVPRSGTAQSPEVPQSQWAIGAAGQGDPAGAGAPFLPSASTWAAAQDGGSRRAQVSPTGADSARPSKSGTVEPRDPLQASRISRKEFEDWRLSVVAGHSRRSVAVEINARHGIRIATAESWFKASAPDGLSDRGRRVFYPESRTSASALSEEQVRSVANSYKNGTPIKDALAAVGQPNVASETMRQWLDESSEDGLNERGRTMIRRLQKDRFIATGL
jgi:hypothetical protein